MLWCTQQGSNLQPMVSKTTTLPIELWVHMVQPAGIEPTASAFAGLRSSNWAMIAFACLVYVKELKVKFIFTLKSANFPHNITYE